MESRDVKRYLNQTNSIDLRIRAKLEQLDKLQQLLTKLGESDRTVKAVSALQEEIDRDVEELVFTKREIMDWISRLSMLEYKTVLELRYLRGWSMKRIAANMNYSLGYAYDIHASAVEEISRLIKRS